MSSEKIVCSISNYINKNIPDFNELLTNVCLTKLTDYTSPNGITFVKPDSKLVKKYLDDTDNIISDEHLIEIQNFCRRHFLKSSLVHHSGDTVVNAERKILKYEKDKDNFKVTDGKKTVTLKKSNFRLNNRMYDNEMKETKVCILEPMSSSDNIHVLIGSDMEKRERIEKPPRKVEKTGGGVYNRLDLEDIIRQTYSDNFNNSTKSVFVSPYLSLMNSLYIYLKTKHNSLYRSLIKISDVSPEVNFYMFIQPFNTDNSNQIITDAMMEEWGGSMIDYRPITLNNAINEEALEIIKGDMNSSKFKPNKNPSLESFDNDFNSYSSFVGTFSVDTLKWMTEFRVIYSNLFRSHNEKSLFNTSQVSFDECVRNIMTYFNGNNKSKNSVLVRGKKNNLSMININPLYSSIINSSSINLNPFGSSNSINQSNYFDDMLNTLKNKKMYNYVNVNNWKNIPDDLNLLEYNKFYVDESTERDESNYMYEGMVNLKRFIASNTETIKMTGGKRSKSKAEPSRSHEIEDYNNHSHYEELDEVEPQGDVEDRVYEGEYNLEDLIEDEDSPYGGLSAI